MKKILLIGLLLSACISRPPARPLIVMMGQSNMSGRGPWIEEWLNPLVYAFNESMEWESARDPIAFDADDAGHGPINQFSDLYSAQFGEIGLVPCSVGGSSISEWQKGRPLYDACLERISAAGGNVAAVLFFQGERESANPELYGGETVTEGYAQLFEQIILDLRDDIGPFPLIYAQIGAFPELLSEHYVRDAWATIQEEQAIISLDCSAMIETADLSWGNVHFDNAAYDEIGKRFFDAFLALDC